MPDALNVSDLRVTYHDGAEAVRGASLTVAAGDRVGLIGPNGAGKTSLLLAIMGGVKFEGTVVVDGIELSRRTLRDARSRCGMVFQNPDDQLFMPSLLEDVAFGPLNQGLAADAAAARSRRALSDVGLEGFDDRAGHHLSVGEKHLAALATVLSMDVRLLLLDEPAASLDHRSRSRLIHTLAARTEAMLLSTHDLDMVASLCGRVVLLDEGIVVSTGPTDEILADQSLLSRHGLA